MAQRKDYTSEFIGIYKSDRNVKNKDGSSRICIDYRQLNQKLVKDKFPLPLIEDVLDTLQEANVYSTLDLHNGVSNVDVDEDCRKTLQKEAFEKLKKIMPEGPLLHIYKYGRKTELHTDACKQGYGAILLQEADDGKLPPVYYMSKKTNTAEEKYDSYEIAKTMHREDLITRIARGALQLEEFDNKIEHRAGSRMNHVDIQ
ncbi:transposon Tf2-8 polyprotein [Trichonephila clavipes]|nr:transposon Tf2-8 polyprotein [Trichonephila clavipes]